MAYTFINTFIMFFLTTVAGLQPAVAGTITAIGAIWDALINPVIGYLSDHSKASMGRRRAYMLRFCFPLLAAMVLMFTAVDFTYSVKVIYYGFMVIAYWTCFTGFFVPFYALGAEYTQDYKERTDLRSFASFFNIIGTCFSMAMPTLIVEFLEKHGIDTSHAWTLTAALLGVVAVISILMTVVVSKPYDEMGDRLTSAEGEKRVNIIEMFSEYIQLLKLKPMRWLLVTALFFLIAYSMFVADFVYFMTYNIGLSGGGISLAMVFRCICCMIIIPPTAMLCNKTDKRTALMIILIGSGICCIGLRFMHIEGIFMMILYVFIISAATSTYWQVVPAMFYDVCEYDELETGKRREGTIVSVQGLVEAAATGIGAQILGGFLQAAGFDGEAAVQSQEAMNWIFNCTTWVPIVFTAVAVFALYKFPITKAVFIDIQQKLEERKKSGEIQ